MTNIIPIEKLLSRIQCDQLPDSDLNGLFSLDQAYRRAIPFENLDPLAGIAVSSGLESIVEKILINGRGGWCFELNQLFGETLCIAGFKIEYRLARVGYRRPAFGPLIHLVLMVELEQQQWLLDVGFGGPGPTEPLLISSQDCSTSDGEQFRFERGLRGDLTLYRWISDEWSRLYRIEPFEVLPIDIEMANHFTATWPKSPFRGKFICAAFDGNINWTLEGNDLVQRGYQWCELSRTPIEGPEQLKALFENTFRIQVSDSQLQSAWLQAMNNLEA